MSIIALCSASGAPGVTTLALAMALPNDKTSVVVEADEVGSSLAPRFDLDTRGGLLSAYRRVFDLNSFHSDLQAVRPDPSQKPIPVFVGQSTHGRRGRVTTYWQELANESAPPDSALNIIADCGRILPDAANIALLGVAGVVCVVTRPNIESVFHAEALVRRLRQNATLGHCGIVLVGHGPFSRSNVADAVSAPVIGVIPDDPRAADVLCGEKPPQCWLHKSELVRAASDIYERCINKPGEIKWSA